MKFSANSLTIRVPAKRRAKPYVFNNSGNFKGFLSARIQYTLLLALQQNGTMIFQHYKELLIFLYCWTSLWSNRRARKVRFSWQLVMALDQVEIKKRVIARQFLARKNISASHCNISLLLTREVKAIRLVRVVEETNVVAPKHIEARRSLAIAILLYLFASIVGK